MSTITPIELRQKMLENLSKIDGDERLLPEINNSNDIAEPYIEIRNTGYDYICRERNVEIFRKMPYDTNHLMYEVFKDVTFSIAMKWELVNRKEDENSRLKLLEKQIKLMDKINPEFGLQLRNELKL